LRFDGRRGPVQTESSAMQKEVTMAELDAASIFLIILAVGVAPWVLPVILRFMRAVLDPVSRWFE